MPFLVSFFFPLLFSSQWATTLVGGRHAVYSGQCSLSPCFHLPLTFPVCVLFRPVRVVIPVSFFLRRQVTGDCRCIGTPTYTKEKSLSLQSDVSRGTVAHPVCALSFRLHTSFGRIASMCVQICVVKRPNIDNSNNISGNILNQALDICRLLLRTHLSGYRIFFERLTKM